MALEIKQSILKDHLQRASGGPKLVDVWLGTAVSPKPKGGSLRWKSRVSSRASLSIRTDLNASKEEIPHNAGPKSTMQTSQPPRQDGHPRTPSKPASASSPPPTNTARAGMDGAGSAVSPPSAPRVRPHTPRTPGSASTAQSANPPQGPRNPGSAGTTASRPNQSSPNCTKMISRSSPKPLRESPRAPKHSLAPPTGQPTAKRHAPDLSQPHGKCVKIYVGEDRSGEPFIIHRNVVSYYSPYFERIFKREEDHDLFISDGMPSLVYKNTTRETFGVFMQYVYRTSIKDNHGNYPSMATLLQFWVLASKVFVPELQNAAVQGIFEQKGEVSCDWVLYVYKNTSPGSLLRKLIVDQILVRRFTIECLVATFEEDLEKLPKELLADVVIAQKKLLSSIQLPTLRVADYYVRGRP